MFDLESIPICMMYDFGPKYVRGEINIKPDGFHKMLNFHRTSKMKVCMESLSKTALIMISVLP